MSLSQTDNRSNTGWKERAEMSESKHGLDFGAGFMIGALAGAAVALLFAPRSGEETRLLMRERGIELRDQADKLGSEVRTRAEGLGAQAKEKAGEFQTQVKRAVEEGRTKAQEDLLAQVEQPEASTGTPAA
jgi:gas vesicle protein